jgi:hypothetical protein
MPIERDERIAARFERVAPRARRMLSTVSVGMGQEAAPGALEGARPRLGPPDEEDARAIAVQLRQSRPRTPPVSPVAGRDPMREADAIATQLVAQARAIMSMLDSGAPDCAINGEDVVALESVMRARGRPALCVEGERIEAIDPERHPGSGFWRSFIDDYETNLIKVASATGAVVVHDRFGKSKPWVQGTAWLVSGDLVITNRHVLFPPLNGMRLARRRPGAMTTARFKSDLKVTIDFAFDNGPTRTVCRPVVDVPFVSEERDPVDVAVIRIATSPAATLKPPALALATNTFDSDQLYVVGHPGRMPNVPEEVLAVFGTPNERKRMSFGELMDPDPSQPNEILHDASTIGGYSGGCVLGFDSPSVVALHYYGDPANGNRAITVAALRAHAVRDCLCARQAGAIQPVEDRCG